MFDFATSRNQRRKLTKLFIACGIASCLAHFMVLILLIKYPQVLQGAISFSFRLNIIRQSDKDNETGRIITYAGDPQRMNAPSAAILGKWLAALGKKESAAPPPIRIRSGNAVARSDRPPMPKVPEVKNPAASLPPNDWAPLVSDSTMPGTGNPKPSAGTKSDSTAGKEDPARQPSPGVAVKPEVALIDNVPSKIPPSISPPLDTTRTQTKNVDLSNNQGKPTPVPQIDIFDNPSPGFPMGEYINLVVERIKQKWNTANLKNSQGHTTVIFYINKSGQYANARIVTSSGSKPLDDSALLAIIGSNPFPALPKGFPGDHIGAKFVFSYNEPN
jgi:TonB family protein